MGNYCGLAKALPSATVRPSAATPDLGHASRGHGPTCADVWPQTGSRGRLPATGGPAALKRVENESARHGPKRVPILIWAPREVNQWREECITFRLN
jgi:hypothetical protein